MKKDLVRSHPQAAQHNVLVRAPLKLNINEARIFALALSCIHRNDKQLPQIKIRFDKAFPGNKNEAYEAVDKATSGLMSKIVELQTVNGKSKVTEKYSLFSYIKLDTKTGLITGWFDERIAPYLVNMKKNFTSVEIETLLTLKNAHTQRIYWLLRSYMHEGEHEFELTEFRKQVLGEDHLSHYPNYADFKRFILLPVVKEIQASGWLIDVTEIKFGLRKIYGLKFILPNYVDLQKAARKVQSADEKLTRATLVKERKPAVKKAAAAVESGELRLPGWLVDYPKRDGALQYQRLIDQFRMTAPEAKHIIEGLANEADFLHLTKTMLAVLAPKAGEPPIANLAAVLKARLAR